MNKPLTVLIDYMRSETEQYRWNIFHISIAEEASADDIMAIVPYLLRANGESGKVRIGLVAVSNQLIDIEEFESFNKEEQEPTAVKEYLEQHDLRPIFIDTDY